MWGVLGNRYNECALEIAAPVCYRLAGPVDTRTLWLSGLNVMGACISDGSLKGWDAKCGLHTSIIWEKLGAGSKPHIVWCCAKGVVYGKSMFQLFLLILMWVFFHFSIV